MNLTAEAKQKVIETYRISPNDVGSTPVQIALLTEHIKILTEHLKKFKKDLLTQKGLTRMVSQRRKLLKYMKKSGLQAYRSLIQKLGIRETL